MQVNCCVFPAPKQFQLTSIIDKILLIPKDPTSSAQYYKDMYFHKQINNNNQFAMHVNSRKLSKSGVISTESTEIPKEDKKFEVYSNLKQKASKMAVEKMKLSPISIQQKFNQKNIQKVSTHIPCLFIPSIRKDKILLFFHGNGEDLSSSFEFGFFISNQLEISVLIVQYQGYSIYEGNSTPENIIQDSKTVLSYLFKCGYDPKSIIIFGRSIGGSIALGVGSALDISCLILLSPFLSLKKVAEDLYGKCASSVLKQTFDNASIIQTIKSPILIIHGMKDTLVPYHHSISILKQCKGYTRLKLVENMTHVKFNFRHDFISPVKKFLSDLNILVK